jgi:hypothetical protein
VNRLNTVLPAFKFREGPLGPGSWNRKRIVSFHRFCRKKLSIGGRDRRRLINGCRLVANRWKKLGDSIPPVGKRLAGRVASGYQAHSSARHARQQDHPLGNMSFFDHGTIPGFMTVGNLN